SDRDAFGLTAGRSSASFSCSAMHLQGSNASADRVPDPSSTQNAPPHHRPGGGFQNPWPGAELHGFKDLLRWRLVDRRAHSIPPDPPYGSLPTQVPAIVAPRAPRGHHTVTWVGHSTVLLQLGPLNVLTDPVWSERASPVQWAGPR